MFEIYYQLLKAPRWFKCSFIFFVQPIVYIATKKKILKRVKKVFPDMPLEQAQSIVKKTVKINLKNILYCLDFKQEQFHIHNLDLFEKRGPVVFATMHTGKIDSSTWALQNLGFKVTTIIGAKPKKAKLRDFAERLIKDLRINYILNSKGLTFELIGELKKQKSVFIHSDFRGSGPKVKLLDHETEVPGTAASVSVLGKVPLLFIYTISEGNENQVFIEQINPPSPMIENKARLIEYLTQEIAKKMESVIRAHPEQWFWFYNRFK